MEDRIKKLEMVTTRLMRRARKKVVSIITPYPISNAVFGEDVKGTVLRYMFPCEGMITKGFIKFGKKPKNGVSVEMKIFDDTHADSKAYTLNKKSLPIEPKLKVVPGDCLEVVVNPLTEEDKVTEVWVSFLWIPTVKDVEVKSYLIEELEKDLIEE